MIVSRVNKNKIKTYQGLETHHGGGDSGGDGDGDSGGDSRW